MLLSKRETRKKERKAMAKRHALESGRNERVLRGEEVEALDCYAYAGVEIHRTKATKPTEPSLQELYQINKTRSRSRSETPSGEDRLVEISEHLKSRCRVMKFQIYEIGALLVEAKRLLAHGEFRNWVKDNCDFSRTTAFNCMRVYRACIGCPGMVNYFKPTTLYAITSKSFPKDLREILFEGVNEKTKYLSSDEVLALANAWKNGEVTRQQVKEFKLERSKEEITTRAKKELDSVKEFIKGKIAILEDGPRVHDVEGKLDEYNDEVNEWAVKGLSRCIKRIDRCITKIPNRC